MFNNAKEEFNYTLMIILGIIIVLVLACWGVLLSLTTSQNNVMITTAGSSKSRMIFISTYPFMNTTAIYDGTNSMNYDNVYGEVVGEVANITSKFKKLLKVLMELQEKYDIPMYIKYGVVTTDLRYVVEGLRVVTPTLTPTPIPLSITRTAKTPEYSVTNVQVINVDEHDLVKNNGTHIFVAAGGTVYVIRAYPINSIRKELVINITNDIWNITGSIEIRIKCNNITVPILSEYLSVNVKGLYITKDRIIVIAETYYPRNYILREGNIDDEIQIPAYILRPVTWVLQYSSNGELLNYAWITGNLVDSRLARNRLVIVTREEIHSFPKVMYCSTKIIESKFLRTYTSWGSIPEKATAIIGLPIDQVTNVMLLNISSGNTWQYNSKGTIPKSADYN